MWMPYPLSKKDKERLKKLGAKVKSIREGKGMSLADLGNAVDKDRQSIHSLEKGNFNPSYIYLTQICKGLEIELSELVEGV